MEAIIFFYCHPLQDGGPTALLIFLSNVEIIVLFQPVVERCTVGKWPRPATQNCTIYKIGCAWAILGAQVGLLGAQSTLFRLKNLA